MTRIPPAQFVWPIIITSVLSFHGWRRKSLQLNGAICAWFVGAVMYWVPDIDHRRGTSAFGWGLVWFYIVGSFITKVGKNRKRLLEQPAHISGAGYRTAAQVLENTLSALISCLLYDWFVVSDQHDFGRPDICPVDLNIGRSLLFITLGHYGCCLGDTFASELGILTPGGPWLITTGKKVQRGVNGAVSLGGTLASAVGGASVGLVMALGMGCGYGEFLAWGATAGLVGSVVDSVLGATMQETRVDEKGIVVNDHSGKVIHGRDTLSNGQVNLLSGLATACLIGWLAP